MDVLHHDLESVEAPSLRNLDLSAEALNQVLIDNAIRGSEEGKNVRDEVALVIVHAGVPVVEILGQIDFLSSPERSFVLLVHLPDLFRVSLSSRGVPRPLYALVTRDIPHDT